MSNKKAIGVLTLINLAVAAFSVLYTVLQVKFFSFGSEITAFFAASSFIYLINSLSQSGQLSEIFLPVYHKIKKDNSDKAAHEALSVVLTWAISAMLIVGAIFLIGAPVFIKMIVPGFSIEQQAFATEILRVFSFFFVFQITQTFFAVFLNAEKIYGNTELTQLIIVIINISMVVIFHESLGVWSMVIGMWVGRFIQIIYFLILSRKVKFRFKWVYRSTYFNHRLFFSSMFSTIIYALSNQLFQIVLTAMISFLAEGVYPIYKYVQQLFTKTNGILMRPAKIVFFTEFSEKRLDDKSHQRETTAKVLRFTLTLSAVVLVFISSFGQTILSFLWANHVPGPDLFQLAYILLIVNFSGLIFLASGGIYRQIAISYGLAKRYYITLSIRQLLNCGIAAISIYFFKELGLAIMLFLNAFLMEFLTVIFLKKHAPQEIYKFNWKFWGALILFVVLTGIVGYFIESEIVFNLGSGRIFDFVNLCLKSIILLSVVLIVGRILRIDFILGITRFVSKKLKLT